MGFPMTSTIFPWVFLWNPSFSHGFSYEITIFPWVFPWNPPFSPDYCSPGPPSIATRRCTRDSRAYWAAGRTSRTSRSQGWEMRQWSAMVTRLS
jgi:hypothetical protein